MTERKKFIPLPIHPASVARAMLLGGGIALILIIIFLNGAESRPEWGKFWMIKPFIVVPLAGSFGGLFFYFMNSIALSGSWKKILAIIFGFIGYVFTLWIGTVLGLNGTLWD